MRLFAASKASSSRCRATGSEQQLTSQRKTTWYDFRTSARTSESKPSSPTCKRWCGNKGRTKHSSSRTRKVCTLPKSAKACSHSSTRNSSTANWTSRPLSKFTTLIENLANFSKTSRWLNLKLLFSTRMKITRLLCAILTYNSTRVPFARSNRCHLSHSRSTARSRSRNQKWYVLCKTLMATAMAQERHRILQRTKTRKKLVTFEQAI